MNFSFEDSLKFALKLARLNPRLYLKEITWAGISFFLVICLFYLVEFCNFGVITLLKDGVYTPVSFSILKFFLWLILFLIGKPVFDLFINVLFEETHYIFRTEDFYTKWISSGAISVQDNPEPGLVVKDSQSGCLLNSHSWRNFRMNFDMIYLRDLFNDKEKYHLRRSVGVLFRAQNLENYFMMEIIGDDNGSIFIKPHIRMFGIWQVIEERKISNVDIKSYFKVELYAKDKVLICKINNGEYTLILPTNNDFDSQKTFENKKNDDSTVPTVTPDIPFRNNYGKIGFRAYPGQGAFIKKLEVKSIFSLY